MNFLWIPENGKTVSMDFIWTFHEVYMGFPRISYELSTAMSEDPSDPMVILFDSYHREDSRFDLRF